MDVTAVLNGLMDEQTIPRVVLWHRPHDERGTWWVVADPEGITVVALALMTQTRSASELRWFLDVSFGRFETDRSGGKSIRDTWLPIQALWYGGLQERWVATRFRGLPSSTIDRIKQVTRELFGRPVEVVTNHRLSRLAAMVYPPPKEDRIRGFHTWRTDPEVRAWSETAYLLSRLIEEPDTAPWPAQEEVDPRVSTSAEIDSQVTAMRSSREALPAIMATARPGFRRVERDELFICALAASGRIDIDMLQPEFGDGERVSALFRRTAALIAEVVDFLREDCEMPHRDLALHGNGDLLFPALVRYVALHGRPTGTAATQLCQWYWRWSLTRRKEPSLPDLLASLDEDPVGSAERLLAQTPGPSAAR